MNRRLSIFVIILFFLLPVATRAQVTGSFRFAQLTDIHLNPQQSEADRRFETFRRTN